MLALQARCSDYWLGTHQVRQTAAKMLFQLLDGSGQHGGARGSTSPLRWTSLLLRLPCLVIQLFVPPSSTKQPHHRARHVPVAVMWVWGWELRRRVLGKARRRASPLPLPWLFNVNMTTHPTSHFPPHTTANHHTSTTKSTTMTRVAFLDCKCGVAGDMLLGALVDAVRRDLLEA